MPQLKLSHRRRGLLALLLAALSLTGFLYYVGFWGGNIRTVVPGRFYRSAQLRGETLRGLLREKGIRTVVNLRGGDEDEDWLQDERQACSAQGADYQQLALSATSLPRPRLIRRVLDILDRARYPVLIHCRQGADRSGLIATLYLHIYQGVPLDQAQAQQLTWRYGHVGIETGAMREFLDLYRTEGRGKSLRDWIRSDYAAVYAREKQERRAHHPAAHPPRGPISGS